MKTTEAKIRKIIREELSEARGGTRGEFIGRASRFHGGEYDYAVLPNAIMDAAAEAIQAGGSFLQDWEYSDDFAVERVSVAGDHAVVTLSTPRGELDFTVTVRPRMRRR